MHVCIGIYKGQGRKGGREREERNRKERKVWQKQKIAENRPKSLQSISKQILTAWISQDTLMCVVICKVEIPMKCSFYFCLCMSIPSLQFPTVTRRGQISPGVGVTGDLNCPLWVLGTELRSPGSSASVLNHQILSPDHKYFLEKEKRGRNKKLCQRKS